MALKFLNCFLIGCFNVCFSKMFLIVAIINNILGKMMKSKDKFFSLILLSMFLFLVLSVESQPQREATQIESPLLDRITQQPNGTNSSVLDPSKKCMDVQFERIDAVAKLSNKSIMVVIGTSYWMLEPDQWPMNSTRQPIINLMPRFVREELESQWKWERTLQKKQTFEKMNDFDLNITIDTMANVKLKVLGNTCVQTSELLIISTLPNGERLYMVHSPDGRKAFYSDHRILDYLNAAKSIDFNRKIDGMFFLKNWLLIFQGSHLATLTCQNGQWEQVIYKYIDDVFKGAVEKPVDAAYISGESPLDMESALLFYGTKFQTCSVVGNDPCKDPEDIVDHFFKADGFCVPLKTARTTFIIAGMVIMAVIGLLCLLLSVFFLIFKPVQLTYFVNEKYGAKTKIRRSVSRPTNSNEDSDNEASFIKNELPEFKNRESVQLKTIKMPDGDYEMDYVALNQ